MTPHALDALLESLPDGALSLLEVQLRDVAMRYSGPALREARLGCLRRAFNLTEEPDQLEGVTL